MSQIDKKEDKATVFFHQTLMKKHKLQAQPRTQVGRKVKHLRSGGQTPATVYGKNIKSTSVQVATEAFTKVYQQAGESGLVELTIGSDVRPVLVNTVQVHPVTRQILHIEFRQVDLKEKVKANVPVVLIGDSPAVQEKIGVLLVILDEVEVEALPTDLPENIELDSSGLKEVDQELKVSALKVPSGVTILTEGEQTLVKVGSLVSKEAQAQEAQEAAAAQAAAAPVEGAQASQGEAPQGDEKKEEAAPPEKKEDKKE